QTIAWWSQWVQTLSTLTLIAVVLAAMHGFGNDSWSHRKLLAVFLVVQCGAGFVAGFKSAVLVPLVYTLFTYYFFKRSIPKRVVLAAVVVPLLLVPANLAFRGAVGGAHGTATCGAVVDL